MKPFEIKPKHSRQISKKVSQYNLYKLIEVTYNLIEKEGFLKKQGKKDCVYNTLLFGNCYRRLLATYSGNEESVMQVLKDYHAQNKFGISADELDKILKEN